MLVELVVENFAVVERLRLSLQAGLNALTGETGSGKSLVVDAFGLLLEGALPRTRSGPARSGRSSRGGLSCRTTPRWARCWPMRGSRPKTGSW